MAPSAVQTSTDAARIGPVLDRCIASDPVRGTLLGTIRISLGESAWGAWQGDAVAARSGAEWPVAMSAGWGPDSVPDLVAALARVPELRGVSGPVDLVETVTVALGRAQIGRDSQGLHRLDELTLPHSVGAPLLAGDVHRHLVREWFAAFMIEAHELPRPSDGLADSAVDGRGAWLWVDGDGTPVSMAVRRPVLGGSARVGPVYTPPPLRGHGYGSAVTAIATRTILDEGAIPVLFTDLTNPTSNKIYRSMGYRLVERRSVVTFAE